MTAVGFVFDFHSTSSNFSIFPKKALGPDASEKPFGLSGGVRGGSWGGLGGSWEGLGTTWLHLGRPLGILGPFQDLRRATAGRSVGSL